MTAIQTNADPTRTGYVLYRALVFVYVHLGWSMENCGVERISERKASTFSYY